jgi:hypothetical protein
LQIQLKYTFHIQEFLSENHAAYEIMSKKYGAARQAADDHIEARSMQD